MLPNGMAGQEWPHSRQWLLCYLLPSLSSLRKGRSILPSKANLTIDTPKLFKPSRRQNL